MSTRTTLAIAAATALALGAAIPAATAAPSETTGEVVITAPYADGQLIVGFKPGTPAADQASALAGAGAARSEKLTPLAPNDRLVRLGAGRSVGQALAALRNNPNVRYADPDYVVTTQATSNDPYFTGGSLWGMYGNASSPANQYGSQAAEAWAAGQTGSRNTYVVVIDEGIQVTHPDLAANVWTNQNDLVDGIDNDGNGYIDDVNGWDFVNNDRTVYDSTGDDHATHVAGTIGGVGGNGVGVAGVNWNVTMISAKFLGANGGYLSDAIKAVDYATGLKKKQGLDIVATSNSWGGGGYTQGLLDAINRGGQEGILFIAAAGNSATNNDTTASYPSNYVCTGGGFDCVVAVAAIDSNGNLASFSQYGATTVDLGAPGVSIQSTLPLNTYGAYSGTSMATPHVSGAAALCASADLAKRGASLRTALLSLTTPTASLSGRTVTGGRLDLTNLASTCAGTPPPPAVAPTITSFSPSSGYPGSSVTVSGTDLTGASAKIGTLTATVTASSSTSLTLTVPASAASGPISVTTTGGTATSTTNFSVLAAAVPGAPTGVTATAGNNRNATVRWTQGATNGSALTSQTIRVFQGSTSTTVWRTVTVSASATSANIGSLTRSQVYRFTVSATNSIGAGPQSAYSNAITAR